MKVIISTGSILPSLMVMMMLMMMMLVIKSNCDDTQVGAGGLPTTVHRLGNCIRQTPVITV